jgi:hypothetical protein
MRRTYRRRNPKKLSSGQKGVLVVGGIAVLGIGGYLLYQYQSQQATASSGGGTISSSTQSTTLGPGGSSSALGPASGASSNGTTISGSAAYGPEASTAPPVSESYEAG